MLVANKLSFFMVDFFIITPKPSTEINSYVLKKIYTQLLNLA